MLARIPLTRVLTVVDFFFSLFACPWRAGTPPVPDGTKQTIRSGHISPSNVAGGSRPYQGPNKGQRIATAVDPDAIYRGYYHIPILVPICKG